MKDSSETASQIALLKQKLQSARAAFSDLDEDRNTKLQTLLQFISKLSLACKGQNLELDNKLAKLRSNLKTFERIDEVMFDLIEIESLLSGQHQHVSVQLEESRQQLSKLVRQMQRVDSAADKSKKEISFLKKELNKPFHTVWEFIPKVEQVVAFYEELIQSSLKESTKIKVQAKHTQMALELAQMVTEIEFRKDQKEQVANVKSTLTQKLSVNDLLDAYQTILSLMLDNIAKEKSASQEFLFALNDALSAVREVVNDSFSHSQRTQQLKSQLNNEINSRVETVNEVVTETNDIATLKRQVTEHLASIRAVLARKEALEQKEQAVLHKSMDVMRNELNELSSEANNYKEKLFEQQKINLLDSLTQLPNRTALEERMEQEYRNYQRNKRPLWIAVADIDHFKSINDNFGHSTGDKALQVISMALKNSLRESEFIARFGGEEFVLIIPDVNATDIAQLLNRVREKIKSIPFMFKDQKITVTVSIGAAQIIDNESIQETFERADAALYRAKHQSRDRVIIDA